MEPISDEGLTDFRSNIKERIEDTGPGTLWDTVLEVLARLDQVETENKRLRTALNVEAENRKLTTALEDIKELTDGRQLPLTMTINDLARTALGEPHDR